MDTKFLITKPFTKPCVRPQTPEHNPDETTRISPQNEIMRKESLSTSVALKKINPVDSLKPGLVSQEMIYIAPVYEDLLPKDEIVKKIKRHICDAFEDLINNEIEDFTFYFKNFADDIGLTLGLNENLLPQLKDEPNMSSKAFFTISEDNPNGSIVIKTHYLLDKFGLDDCTPDEKSTRLVKYSKVLSTIIHETIHAWQHQLVDQFNKKNLPKDTPKSISQLAKMLKNSFELQKNLVEYHPDGWFSSEEYTRKIYPNLYHEAQALGFEQYLAEYFNQIILDTTKNPSTTIGTAGGNQKPTKNTHSIHHLNSEHRQNSMTKQNQPKYPEDESSNSIFDPDIDFSGTDTERSLRQEFQKNYT